MAEQELELQELNGTVTAVLYSNAENGYTVLKLQDEDDVQHRGHLKARVMFLVLFFEVHSRLRLRWVTERGAIYLQAAVKVRSKAAHWLSR